MSAAKTETRPKEQGEGEGRVMGDAPAPVVTATPPSGTPLGRTTSEESAGSQGSGGKPQAQKPRGEQAAGFRRQGGERRGRDRSISAGSSTDQQDLPADPKPAEGRKRLQLKPRSKPLDAPVETTSAGRSAAIFGGGRPHDDLEYEKKRQEREAKNPTAIGGAAATVPTVTPEKPVTRERSNSGSWGAKKNEAPRPYSSAYVPAQKTPGSGGKHGQQQPPQPLYPGDPGYNEAVAAKAGAPYLKKSLGANVVSANKEVKKPQKLKREKGKGEADDEWQEVDAHAAKLAAKHSKQEEEDEMAQAQAQKVRNAFAALNLEDEDEDGIEA